MLIYLSDVFHIISTCVLIGAYVRYVIHGTYLWNFHGAEKVEAEREKSFQQMIITIRERYQLCQVLLVELVYHLKAKAKKPMDVAMRIM